MIMRAHTETSSGKSPSQRTVLAAGALALTLAVLLSTESAPAQDGWDFTVDAGVFAESVYVGSDEYYVTPLPSFRASRSAGAFTYFISLPLEGIGVSHTHAGSGLTSSLTVNFGGQRQAGEYSVVGFPVKHSDRTRDLLAGSPDVATPVFVEASVDYPTALGILGASVGYHPTSVEDDLANRDETMKHGLILSLQYTKIVPVARDLTVAGMLDLELMDGNYADAWFAVDHATDKVAGFEAGAGARDVQAALYATYRVSRTVSLSLYGSSMLLLGDAADCPYTLARNQHTFLLRTSYSF